ncbi:MAG: MASE1 domain-containing protein [Myxococcota bacterium]
MDGFKRLAALGLVAIGAAASTLIGFELRGDRDPLSLFWPCGGFVFAVLLVRERRDWPLLLLSTAVGIGIANRVRFGTLHPYLIIAVLEPLLATVLFRALATRAAPASRMRDWLNLMVCGPLVAAGIGGALGAAMLVHAEPGYGFVPLMRSWWLADAIGYILVAPAVLTLVTASRSPAVGDRFAFDGRELTAFAVAFATFTWTVFGGVGGSWRSLGPLEHAVLPLLLWAALRFPWWVSSNALLLYYGIAAWQTTQGNGPFVLPDAGVWGSVVAFQASALSSAIGVQLVLALAAERRSTSVILEENDRRFRDIVESTNEWIWEVDADLRFVYSSPHCLPLLGYTPEELVGTQALRIAIEDDRSPLVQAFEEGVLRGRPVQAIVHRNRRRDGSIVHLESNVVPIFDGQGRVVGCRGMDRDVSARIAAEADALSVGRTYAHSEKLAALGAVASSVAHEINNPNQFITLNMPILEQAWKDVEPAIAGFARERPDWTVAGLPPNEAIGEIADAIAEVTEGSDRIRSIVAELKDFLRGDPVRKSDPIDLGECLRSVVNLVRGSIVAREQRIDLSLGSALPVVVGHRRRIEQVLINLITNASEALEGNPGTISLRTIFGEGERFVTIEVRDEGIGIAEGDLARVMDPFFTTRRSSGGMGLGLAVSARIAREHGGRLEIESRAGCGTTARLVLPVAS